MKPCRFLACGLVAVCSAVASASADQPRSTVAVYVAFETAPSDALFNQIKDEVATILAPAGLDLDWRDLNHRQTGESARDLVVVQFHGSCAAGPALNKRAEMGGTALATTAISDGRVLPFSSVECSDIWNYIAPVAMHEPDPQGTLARAIGRVLAHELFHIFAATSDHSAHGIARAYHSRQDLTGSHFDFDPSDTRLLRDYARRVMVAASTLQPSDYSSR